MNELLTVCVHKNIFCNYKKRVSVIFMYREKDFQIVFNDYRVNMRSDFFLILSYVFSSRLWKFLNKIVKYIYEYLNCI